MLGKRTQPRAKRAKTAGGQQQIIEVATRLFNERGYHGCSLDEVGQALGATKQVIYYQFADKADLLAAISRRGVELSLAALIESESTDAPLLDRLRTFFKRHAQIVIHHAPEISVYVREMYNLKENDRRKILSLRAEVDRRLANMVAEGVKAGAFNVEDSLTVTRAMTGSISYMCFWARQTSQENDDRLAQQMADFVLRMLGSDR